MLRMRNKFSEDLGILVWIGDSWHLYHSKPGVGNPVHELTLSDFASTADDLSYLLDELALREWEVIG